MTLQKLRELYEASDIGPSTQARGVCWDRFLEIGLPTHKNEAYRYIKLHDLEQRYFEKKSVSFSCPIPADPTLVFMEGKYDETLSNLQGLPKEMIVLPMSKAWRTFGTSLKGHYFESMKKERDPFAALNGALSEDGAFVYLPPATVVKVPLNITRMACSTSTFSTPRLHLHLGKGAKLEVYLRDIQSAYSQNSMVDIVLEEGADLKISTIVAPDSDAFHIEALRATLKRQSILKALLITTGSKMFRYDACVSLAGQNAEVDLKGLAFVTNKNEAHFGLRVDHLAPECRSLQKFKNLLSDYSKTSFEGKIFVDPIAQKTAAYQMNPNLLLSERALAISRPNLEIFADDVKASHGSVVGQINENDLFYLRSRGLSESAAMRLLIKAFCNEIMSEITLPSFQNEALELVSP